MSPSGRSKWARLLPGLLISGAVIVWIVLKTDLEQTAVALKSFNPWWIAPLVAVYLLGFVLRGLRWQIMLRPVVPIHLRTSTGIVLVGYMANNLLPARLGEFVRAYMLDRKTRVGKSAALTSVGVERVFDGLVLVAIFAVTALMIDKGTAEQREVIVRVGVLASAIFLTALAGVLVMRIRPGLIESISAVVTRPAPERIRQRLMAAVRNASKALMFLSPSAGMLAVVLLSIGVWVTEGSMFVIGLQAMKLSIGPVAGYFALAVVNLGILVPSSPGYVGVFQGCAILALAAFSVDQPTALAYGIVIHALQFFPVTIIGLVVLNVMGFSLGPISHSAGDAEEAR